MLSEENESSRSNSSTWSQFYSVVYYTFIDLWSTNVIWNIAFFAPIIIFIPLLASKLSYGMPDRIVLNLGLSCLNISNAFMAFYLAGGLISNEYNNRTLYMIFSRPLKRSLYLLGKLTSLSLLLLLNAFVLGMIAIILVYCYQNALTPLLFHQVIFFYLQSVIILFLLVLFSLLFRPFLAISASFTLFLVGHGLDEMQLLIQNPHTTTPLVKAIALGLFYLIPHFYRFDIQQFVLYNPDNLQMNSNQLLLSTYAYTFVVLCVLFFISSKIIQNKELD